MEKIKVMHVYKSFNVYNGLIEILTILARKFDHTRFELGVCVFEYERNHFGEDFEKLGGKIFNLSVKQKAVNEPASFWELYRFFREYKPHVVQTHVLKANFMGTLAAVMAKVPVVIGTEMTLRDTAPNKTARLRDRLVQPLASMAINRCDSFVVTSRYIKKEWEKSVKSDLFKIVYPPFNLEKYHAACGKKRKSDGKQVGFIGRLSDEKRVDRLLEAMQIVCACDSEVSLTIVGTGPLENELKRYAVELGIESRVNFTGYKPNVFEALRQMDIFVLSSRTEGCPIVILEAMAAGLPVVATKVGGNLELVRDGDTGFLVEHDSPGEIAGAILKLTGDPVKAEKMGKKGKQVAFTQFHPDKFCDSLVQLYEEFNTKKEFGKKRQAEKI